jgi:N-acetylglucosamine-6-phosphate deacetylase
MSLVVETFGPNGYGSYKLHWINQKTQLTSTDQHSDHWLVPGFIDIHFHGAFGIDFMTASESDLLDLADKLEAKGYEGVLLTTVTSSLEEIVQAIHHIPQHPIVLGFHLEGPFISKRFPGAQPAQNILSIPDDLSLWNEVFNHPDLKVVTLAPEIPNASSLIRKLSNRNVIVSLGHSDATFNEAEAAYSAGAKSITHFYNAMRGLHQREPGLAGFGLLNDNIYTELIYDRHHVCHESAKLLIKNKPIDRLIAISDSTLATGMPTGSKVNLWGNSCAVEEGTIRNEASQSLAGTTVTLLEVFKNLWEDFGPMIAIQMCCHNPRELLGIKKEPSKWLLFNRNKELLDIFQNPLS